MSRAYLSILCSPQINPDGGNQFRVREMPKSLYQLKLDYDTLTPEQEVEFLKAYVLDVGIDLGGAEKREQQRGAGIFPEHARVSHILCSCRTNERRRGRVRRPP